MEFRDYLIIARRWAWLLILTTAVAAVGSWVGTRFMPSTYRSTTTLMVGRAMTSSADAQVLYVSSELAKMYSQMATREPVLQGVVDALELPLSWSELRGMVKASPQPGAPLLEIAVITTNAEASQVIVREVANQLMASTATERLLDDQNDADFLRQQMATLRESIEKVQPEISELQSQLDTATSARQIAELRNRIEGRQTQLDEWRGRYIDLRSKLEGDAKSALQVVEAATPAIRVGPDVTMNVLFAALLGLSMAVGAVALLEYLDDTVKTPEQIERRAGVTALASMMKLDSVEHRADGLVALNAPRSPMSELYRTLRTNVGFALLQREAGPLVITSPAPGEGKSTVAVNLAVVFAQSGKRVALVDGDLRAPSLHRFFGFTNNLGFTSLMLEADADPQTAMRQVEGAPGLDVLTSGPLPPNPSEVLGSDRAQAILAALQETHDVVIIDSAPVLLVTDPVVLAQRAAGTVMVLEAGRTRVDAVRRALELLAKSGVKPLGCVVNKLEAEKAGGYYRYAYYSYYRGYGHHYYGEDPGGRGDGGGPEGTGGGGGGPGNRAGPAAERRSARRDGGRSGRPTGPLPMPAPNLLRRLSTAISGLFN